MVINEGCLSEILFTVTLLMKDIKAEGDQKKATRLISSPERLPCEDRLKRLRVFIYTHIKELNKSKK